MKTENTQEITARKMEQSDKYSVEGRTGVINPTVYEPGKKMSVVNELKKFRADVTTFSGFTGTRPKGEFNDLNWDELSNIVCPEKPQIVEDKKDATYFLPCKLRETELVGKTLGKALTNGESTIGKMRSKNHVTQATFLVMDIDGIPEATMSKAFRAMEANQVTYLYYSTHSHGREDKTGARYRMIVPMDRAVSGEEYTMAWNGLDTIYFEGQIAKADSSGSKMYQQQGGYCCHPQRKDQAEREVHNAGLVQADDLIEKGRGIKPNSSATVTQFPSPKRNSSKNPSKTYPASDANKVADNCLQIGSFRDTKGKYQSEPLWHACLGIVGHCTEGKSISHDWSRGYDGYDKTETDTKLNYRLNCSPTTCAHFMHVNPEGCVGCEQLCHSPIVLGWSKPDALKEIQQQFSLIKIGGKVLIVEQGELHGHYEYQSVKGIEFLNRIDGRLMIDRYLAANHPDANKKAVFDEFLKHPDTTCYDGVTFDPKGSDPNLLNLWVEPTATPIKGSWRKIKKFLLRILCNGDRKAYRYLLNFLAHALQYPEEKPGIMLVLIGGQGTGKGTFGTILRRIWGQSYLHINNIAHIAGDFNGGLERSYIVFMDEALFAGNRKATDALKSVVTESVLHINEKHQPARQTPSFHRIIAATNAEHFKHTEKDDRRDFTLRISEERKLDLKYWKELYTEIEHGGVEAMVYDLLRKDISRFNVRNRPVTKELQTQRLESLDHFERWWHECLTFADLGDYFGAWGDEEIFCGTEDIIKVVEEFSGKFQFRRLSAKKISEIITKMCPSAVPRQKQKHMQRSRGYMIPPLHVARQEFEQYMGSSSMEWEPLIEEVSEEDESMQGEYLDPEDAY